LSKLIKEDVFDYLNFNPDVEEGAVFAVPNEIFSDFMQNHKLGKCAYAYSYYYLSMYLHLYAKYGSENTIEKFTFANLQKLLGISPESRIMNVLVKKDGELDRLGYTSTVTDYPVNLIRLEQADGIMEVGHYMYSEEKRDFPDRFTNSTNFKVKHPDKMYWRDQQSKEEDYYNGTMNEPDNTHMVPLEMFLHALNMPDIMTKGFFVYGFIIYKSTNRSRGNGWTIPLELFVEDIGISKNTLFKILKALEERKFIKVKREKGANGIDKPNTYIPLFDPAWVVY
jgi:hypothetical protein